MGTTLQLVGCGRALRKVEEDIACAARSSAKVLVTGESGVGKEIVAKLIHRQSTRARAPMVTVNCAGVPDTLLESEMFGHVRGSFTDAFRDKRGYLEQAHGGTIFMDEVGEMSLRMQALLLRFLENGEIQRVGAHRTESTVDVRVISATNRNLVAEMANKNFREDLYYRLNVIEIAIPPLRERREDIRPLLEYFFQQYGDQHQRPRPHVTEDAIARLSAYDWPGNVRELKNVVERLVIRAQSGIVSPADLPPELEGPPSEVVRTQAKPGELLEQMRTRGESFWTAVHAPFMARDLTRDDVRMLVNLGLEETHGNYKALVRDFNLDQKDYKRFLGFLKQYDCYVPFRGFRSIGSIGPVHDTERVRQYGSHREVAAMVASG
jgi:DNA-binding NtrC family response regulator